MLAREFLAIHFHLAIEAKLRKTLTPFCVTFCSLKSNLARSPDGLSKKYLEIYI